MSETPATHFASPERTDPQTLARGSALIERERLLAAALDVLPEGVLILDANRQIVHCNRRILDALGSSKDALLGKRPGEALGCVHACDMAAGCGTSRFCVHCGSVRSILESLESGPAREECRMTVRREGKEQSLDLRVCSAPIRIGGLDWVLFAVEDIADEKRRQVLQHAFFHDVLNDLTVIMALAEMSLAGDGRADRDLTAKLLSVCRRMGGEIQGHRDLLLAEMGQLTLNPDRFDPAGFLREIAGTYADSHEGSGRSIRLDLPGSAEPVDADRPLLCRVMGCLMRNALEATPAGGSVELGCGRRDGRHVFRVSNPGVMAEAARLQVFQRSYSTKAPDRGIGLYNAKLLTERYLGGRIWFETGPGERTSFFVELP